MPLPRQDSAHLQRRQEDPYGATRDLLKGPAEHWIETLSGFVLELGFDTFVFWPNDEPLEQLQRFAEEVVPAFRR